MSYLMVISPAKKMNVVEGPPSVTSMPLFLSQAERLMREVQKLSREEAKALWRCSDALAALNYGRFATMDLTHGLTAALIAYEGIQYQHLAPQVMSEDELAFLDMHLRMLSGFYGVLRPGDGIVPYRLEMQARLPVDGHRDLYGFWGDGLAKALSTETDTLVNLASVEYAKAVTPYAPQVGMRTLTCLFGCVSNGRLLQRATEAKAARGTFVRWCAERGIQDVRDFRHFSERGYRLDEARTSEDVLVFVRG